MYVPQTSLLCVLTDKPVCVSYASLSLKKPTWFVCFCLWHMYVPQTSVSCVLTDKPVCVSCDSLSLKTNMSRVLLPVKHVCASNKSFMLRRNWYTCVCLMCSFLYTKLKSHNSYAFACGTCMCLKQVFYVVAWVINLCVPHVAIYIYTNMIPVGVMGHRKHQPQKQIGRNGTPQTPTPKTPWE